MNLKVNAFVEALNPRNKIRLRTNSCYLSVSDIANNGTKWCSISTFSPAWFLVLFFGNNSCVNHSKTLSDYSTLKRNIFKSSVCQIILTPAVYCKKKVHDFPSNIREGFLYSVPRRCLLSLENVEHSRYIALSWRAKLFLFRLFL